MAVNIGPQSLWHVVASAATLVDCFDLPPHNMIEIKPQIEI